MLIRFAFSLTNEFWFPDQDVLQIYLIGLKSFTTHSYPYFGADLVYNHSQIPGALQGFLVSAGWYVWKIPESPFIVLNILLSASLGLLAWYTSKRLPDLPKVFIWAYLFLIPWSFCFFTRIVNPSYVIPGAILFFIAFFETYPLLRVNVVSKRLSFFLMGFAICWTMQLHLSWILFGPFAALSFFYLLKGKNWRTTRIGVVSFLVGCIVSGSLLLPTLLRFGFSPNEGSSSAPSTLGLIQVNLENAKELFRDITMYYGYGSFDITRFIAAHTPERIQFLKDYLWAAPFGVFLALIGIAQVIFLLYKTARPGREDGMRPLRNMLLLGLAALYGSSLFSKVRVPAHAAVLLFPLVALFLLHSFRTPLTRKWIQWFSVAVFFSAIITYAAIGWRNFTTISMYRNREAIVRALDSSDYTIVGRRRDDAEFNPQAITAPPGIVP
ncbi:MAG TPA: hypothetical protein VGM92_14035 [Candidatus Kapabacteria bacterium]|jgi:hypothetical protein